MTRKGTIKDDCIVTKVTEEDFYVVINAGCKVTDLAHIGQLINDEF
jgi:glycine cleavage system aminomethyltransferase T